MDQVFSQKEQCSGCSSCSQICPTLAITMEADEKGFLYPNIDNERCIDCQKCRKVCPFIVGDIDPSLLDSIDTYAGKNKDAQIRKESSSGGIFSILTEQVFEHNGVVYGAAFNEAFEVAHIRTTSLEERNQLRGSKYVKSDLSDTFAKVKKDLNDGLFVVFSGVACEVAGLKNYLKLSKVEDERLILVDIICHGGPSPRIWKDYLKKIQAGDRLTSYTFRNKEKAWRGFNIKATYASGTIKAGTALLKIYPYLYGADVIMRDSCYQCPYTRHERVSDIMLGDYWGIESVIPEFEDPYGVSVIYINTQKGRDFFESKKDGLELKTISLEQSLQFNLRKATPKPALYPSFWQTYAIGGFDSVARTVGAYSFTGQLKKQVAQLLRKLKLKKH